MAIDEGEGGAPEPAKEPTVGGTPSPQNRNVAKMKRLLPKELRRRRRAAKLQISSAKKTPTSANEGESVQPRLTSPSTTAAAGATVQRYHTSDTRGTEQGGDTHAAPQAAAATSLIETEGKTIRSAHTKNKSPVAAATTATTQLHSLYASSALNRKKQKLLHTRADVPTSFHVERVPVDLVPKAKVSILTSFPYPFLRCNSFTKKQALQRFIAASGDAVHPGSPLENQSLLVRWHQALHYFKHPAAPLPASFKLNCLATTTTSESLIGGPNRQIRQEEQAFFTARWHTWQETFREVYMSFRRQGGTNAIDSTQHEDSFYLRSNEFTVCFHLDDNDGRRDSILSLGRQHNQKSETPGGPEGDPMQAKPGRYRRLCAVMTQSTARMRKALHRLNVAYSMPYATATRTQREAGEFHLLEEELKAFEADRSRNKANDSSGVPAVTRSVPPVEHVHGTDSLLLFHGHLAVHGLYEFLINRTPMSSQDVPELYALHPFGNATIQTLQATSFGRVGGPAVASPPSDTMENPQARATQFRTEISGFCFPSSVATLLDVLKHVWTTKQETVDQTNRSLTGGRELEVALRAFMEAVPATERLNAIRLDEQLARATGGSGDLQERGKRKQELELSKRRVETAILRQMELPASHYDVETTTRPTVARR